MPDVTIPDVPLTDFVLAEADARGDQPAIICGVTGATLTYRAVCERVRAAAAGLARRGFAKGDVLAMFSPNTPEYPLAFHAAALAGGTITTVNPLYTVDEIVKQLGDAGARWLVTVPALLDRAKTIAERIGARELFVFGDGDGATPFAALYADGGAPPSVAIDPSRDVVALPYSSGTTGLPKGVMLTHKNLVANLVQVEATGLLRPGDRAIAVLPFFHIYGLTVILNVALKSGVTLVTLPRFELDGFLRALAQHRITHAFCVPPIVLALAKHPSVAEHDLSSLRLVFSGAAPLDDGLARACSERLGVLVTQGYGMTETSPVTHLVPNDPARAKAGSVGPVVQNTECKVADVATGAPLGAGERGEICVRGPQIMKGYLNNPDATAAMIDREGWLHTGDIGYADEEGYFFIVDRVKELIKYKGMQVAPAELEAVLVAHPAVADAAVVPSPDEEAGEVPKAFVVKKSEIAADELLAWVASRVAPHKKVRRLEFIDQIPKSPSGKILRRLLVERDRRT